MSNRMHLYRNRGFTLIELLVVVAIIAVLISILLPSLSKARDMARDVQCMSILKQFGMAQHLYADSEDGYFVNCCINDDGYNEWQKQTKFRELLSMSNYFETDDDGKVSPAGLFCPSMPARYRDPDKGQVGDGGNTFHYRGWGYSLVNEGLAYVNGYSVHRSSVERPSYSVQHVDNNDKNSYLWGVDPRTYWDDFGELNEIEGGMWGVVQYRHSNTHANLLHFDSHVDRYTRQDAIDEIDSGEAVERWSPYREID